MTNTILYLTFITTLVVTCLTLTIMPLALYLTGFSEGMILGIVAGLLFLEINTCFWIACQ